LIDYNGKGRVGEGESAGTNLPSDKSLYFNTSLFFLGIWPTGSDVEVAKHSPASVHDGLSNTLMISENVRAGFDATRMNAMGWASTIPERIAFFVSMHVCDDLVCREGQVDYARANGSQLPAATEALNASLDQPEGTPWPSSLHGHGVNFAFCDGRVKFISESIHGAVYAALVSPQGSRIRGPLAQIVPGDSDY
jgi:prepilin-type processing-associated H-X9-DG protein